MRSRLARIASIKTDDRAIAAPFPAAMETMRAGYWKLVLRVAINKHRRKPSRKTENSIAEEVADVEIMIDQMRKFLGDKRIDKFKKSKIARLEKRLEKK